MMSEHVSVGTFFQDTSPLSGTLISSNSRLRKEAGGLANTEQFDNVVVSVYGEVLRLLEAWEDPLDLTHRSAGEGDIKDERNYFSGIYGYCDVDYQYPREDDEESYTVEWRLAVFWNSF